MKIELISVHDDKKSLLASRNTGVFVTFAQSLPPPTWLLVFSVQSFLKGDRVNWTCAGKHGLRTVCQRGQTFHHVWESFSYSSSVFFSWFTLNIQNLSLNSWLDELLSRTLMLIYMKCFSLSNKWVFTKSLTDTAVGLHELYFLLQSAAIIVQSSQLLVSGRAFQMREVHGCTEFPASGRSISQTRWPWPPLGTLPTTTTSSAS